MTIRKLRQFVKEELTKAMDARDNLSRAELRVRQAMKDESEAEARAATLLVRRYYPQIADAAGITL